MINCIWMVIPMSKGAPRYSAHMGRLTRAESQARTREALIEAAATLFGRQGYRETSVDQIADRAGLTRGAVYANFRGKEDLLHAVAERAGDVFEDRIFADRTLPFPLRLRLYVRHLLEEWPRVKRTLLFYSELEMLAMRNAKVRAGMADVYRAMYDRAGAALELDADEHGVPLPLSGAQMLQLVGTATRGLLRERIVRPEPVDEQFLGDALLVIFGYRPADHPLPEPGAEPLVASLVGRRRGSTAGTRSA